jgi:hypothetical protein
MYDLSAGGNEWMDVVIEDWKRLVDLAKITEDNRYLHHNGKPVIGIWGVGVHKRITPQDAQKLSTFFKNDPKYGNCTIFAGGPFNWRYDDGMLDQPYGDTQPGYLDWYFAVDMISPWSVGRYSTVSDVAGFTKSHWKDDLKLVKKMKKDYVPVVYPGTSWHNLMVADRKDASSPVDLVPRKNGDFLWKQFYTVASLGVNTVYVAMFDEINEGTAIYKISNDPPTEAPFVTIKPYASDYYLRLVGAAAKMVRKEIPLIKDVPENIKR